MGRALLAAVRDEAARRWGPGYLRLAVYEENAAARERLLAMTSAREACEAHGLKPPEVVEAAIAELTEVSRLVAAKTPEQAAGFKAWLGEIANKVAEAGTEGGFLGFGGEKVSVAEKAALDKIASVLA